MGKFICAALIITQLLSCGMPYFGHINSMRNIQATVILVNGDTLTGLVSTGAWKVKGSTSINYISETKNIMQVIPLPQVKTLEINNVHYQPVYLQLTTLRNRLVLVQKLSKPTDKIQLYSYQSDLENQTENGMINTQTNSYYYNLSNNTSSIAYSIDGRNCVPNFNKKVSALVVDCYTLSQKIKNKEKGFYYSQIGSVPERRLQVWQNINKEYTNCK